MEHNSTDRAVNTTFVGATHVGAGMHAVRIAPVGAVRSLKGAFLMDESAAAEVVAAFTRHGNDVPIDYEHETLSGSRAPAAGWISKVWWDAGKGLMGLVRWNADARDAIRSGQYGYLSPVFMVRKDDRRPVSLHSAAITNKPAIPKMDRLAASSREPLSLDAGDTPLTLIRRMAVALKLRDPLDNKKMIAATLEAALAKLESLGAEGGAETETDADVSAEAASTWRIAMAENGDDTTTPDQLVGELAAALRAKGVELSEGAERIEVLRAALAFVQGESADAEVAASVRNYLKLAPDAGRDEVVLAMTARGNAEVAALRHADRERSARERVDHYVSINRINPNDKVSYEAALSLAVEAPDRFEAIMGSTKPFVPPGKTVAPGVSYTSRLDLIGASSREWHDSKTLQGLSDLTAYVDQQLRDAGKSKLTDDEKSELS